jgi:glutamate synthase (NADPH/NADH) small chain
MGKDTGFMELGRKTPEMRPAIERVKDFKEHYKSFREDVQGQASRCMDCGVPFCNNGCPLGNRIPEFNDAVYKGNFKEAYEVLRTTNNFPEFTGRICPAPCEAACVLGINKDPITIEHIEKEISERAWEEGWVIPKLPVHRSGKSVAVIGSGPAGLAVADQLNQRGHRVKVFERDQRPGGLLTYGIPDYKLDKSVVARRIEVMAQEGVVFQCGVNVGVDLSMDELQESFDAVVLSIGSKDPRNINVEGRGFNNIHFAMDFLAQNNAKVSNEAYSGQEINAKGKRVLVIGGGDTGSDCIGTSIRQGAASVIQVTIEEQPPQKRGENNPWPEWPNILRTSSSHEEGCERIWGVNCTHFESDENGNVKSAHFDRVKIDTSSGRWNIVPTGEKLDIDCDMAVLAIGFNHPVHQGLVANAGLELDSRGNISSKKFMTNIKGVFTAGDARRGQSLVVHAIAEGRKCAEQIDAYLQAK